MSQQQVQAKPVQIRPQSETGVQTTMAIVVGTNGTGKTTFLRQMCNTALAAGRRVLVIVPDEIEWTDIPQTLLRYGVDSDFRYTGIRRHIFNRKTTLKMLKHFRNGLLIFDDCRAYLKAVTADDVHGVLIRRRQQGIDIMAVAHGFTEIPLVFYTFVSDFVVFKTRDNISRRMTGIQDYEAIRKKVAEVNAIAAGKKPHPKNYNGVDADGKSLAGRKAEDIHYCDTIKNE